MMAIDTSYRAYITGDTYRFRALLRDAGYRWDSDRKAWTRDYDEQISSDQAVHDVRRIGGIRNRGDFSASVEAV